MTRHNRQNPLIREFLLQALAHNPQKVVAMAVAEFGLTRMAIGRYLKRLIEDGLVTAEGATKARRYSLKKLVDITAIIPIAAGVAEDQVWRFRILPYIAHLNKNVIEICQYGFTEMLNNVIDHSGSPDALIVFIQTYKQIEMRIADSGMGIFEKIQRDFDLPDPRAALLELSKGKLTSDKKRHAGEGIFFTSRMFDKFQIMSTRLFYSKERTNEDDWLIEARDMEPNIVGTMVCMYISTEADWTIQSVFKKYQGDSVRFRKTHVPINISAYPGEQLVSRSQAKRILSRFDNFSEVLLDFAGVDHIGQPFADEIFRVFPLDHPTVSLIAIRTNDQINQMIKYVTEGVQDEEPRFL